MVFAGLFRRFGSGSNETPVTPLPVETEQQNDTQRDLDHTASNISLTKICKLILICSDENRQQSHGYPLQDWILDPTNHAAGDEVASYKSDDGTQNSRVIACRSIRNAWLNSKSLHPPYSNTYADTVKWYVAQNPLQIIAEVEKLRELRRLFHVYDARARYHILHLLEKIRTETINTFPAYKSELDDPDPHSPKYQDRTRITGIVDDPTQRQNGFSESESFYNITFDHHEARINDSTSTFRYPMGPRDSINTDNVAIETSGSVYKTLGSKIVGSKGGSYSSFFSTSRKVSVEEKKCEEKSSKKGISPAGKDSKFNNISQQTSDSAYNNSSDTKTKIPRLTKFDVPAITINYLDYIKDETYRITLFERLLHLTKCKEMIPLSRLLELDATRAADGFHPNSLRSFKNHLPLQKCEELSLTKEMAERWRVFLISCRENEEEIIKAVANTLNPLVGHTWENLINTLNEQFQLEKTLNKNKLLGISVTNTIWLDNVQTRRTAIQTENIAGKMSYFGKSLSTFCRKDGSSLDIGTIETCCLVSGVTEGFVFEPKMYFDVLQINSGDDIEIKYTNLKVEWLHHNDQVVDTQTFIQGEVVLCFFSNQPDDYVAPDNFLAPLQNTLAFDNEFVNEG